MERMVEPGSGDSPEEPHGDAMPALAGMEIELKLAADPEVLRKLAKAPIVADSLAGGRLVTRTLHSVYYDTPDHRLLQRGVNLRVRKVGRRFVQTVKTATANGILERGEWETPVPSLDPVLAAVTQPEPRSLLADLAGEPLVAVFATRIKRQKTKLAETDTGAVVEIALDQGDVETLGKRQPVNEVELELVAGAPSAIYRLAQRLIADFPLRTEWRSKSARGYALARGRPPTASKADRPCLSQEDSVGDGLRAILMHCFKHWTDNEAVVLDGSDIEGVHQMRVALRRLRSALGLFRDVIPPADLAWLQEESRWLAGSLGPARDWDVFCTTVLGPVAGFAAGDAALHALTPLAEEKRREGYRTAAAAIGDPRYTRFALRFAEWVEDAGWRHAPPDGAAAQPAWLDRPMADLAATILRDRHRKALKAGRKFTELSPQARHRLRIQLKKLRYAADFFRDLYKSKRVRGYMTALSRLQDALGQLNDVSVARGLLVDLAHAPGEPDAQVARAFAAGEVLGWHQRLAAESTEELAQDWQDFKETPPFWPTGAG
ncbi:MAG: CYTH and CHAD domain-containing protein [Rhodospirillaceae bacterium]|nr:CYTH and CHAD domain-containing protein [Rhodospirillaceae bacterium]